MMNSFRTGAAGIVALSVLAGGAALAPASANTQTPATTVSSTSQAVVAAARQGKLTSTVRGTFGAAGRVTGSFTPSRFYVDNGKVFAAGNLATKLIRGDGTVLGHAHRYVKIPLRSGSGSVDAKTCDILDLLLGPLHLNLLGLHVDLNKVILHITAVAGAGQLLGNLLCAVAHLLDGGPTHLLRLSDLLNQILSILKL